MTSPTIYTFHRHRNEPAPKVTLTCPTCNTAFTLTENEHARRMADKDARGTIDKPLQCSNACRTGKWRG